MSNLNDDSADVQHVVPKGWYHMLNGRTALVVEEQFLIALDIQRMLENLDVGQTLFARSPAEATALQVHWPEVAIAVVEIGTDTTGTLRLIESLDLAGIPSIIVTADLTLDHARIEQPHRPVIVKPVPEAAMAKAVARALAGRSK